MVPLTRTTVACGHGSVDEDVPEPLREVVVWDLAARRIMRRLRLLDAEACAPLSAGRLIGFTGPFGDHLATCDLETGGVELTEAATDASPARDLIVLDARLAAFVGGSGVWFVDTGSLALVDGELAADGARTLRRRLRVLGPPRWPPFVAAVDERGDASSLRSSSSVPERVATDIPGTRRDRYPRTCTTSSFGCCDESMPMRAERPLAASHVATKACRSERTWCSPGSPISLVPLECCRSQPPNVPVHNSRSPQAASLPRSKLNRPGRAPPRSGRRVVARERASRFGTGVRPCESTRVGWHARFGGDGWVLRPAATASSDEEWPASVFPVSGGCWRALAKGATWAGFEAPLEVLGGPIEYDRSLRSSAL